MKKALLFISILSLPLFYSCKTEIQTELSDNQFEEAIKEQNDLFSFGKIHKGAFAERNKYFNYDISLDVVNISDNIFEKTIVKADLELVLQNGNILTAKDSDHIMNLRSIESIDFWKSNETKVIGKYKKFHTRALPNHFKEYPIKQAILVLELTATDIVNNSEEIIIHNIDITEDWKDFLSKKTVKKAETTTNRLNDLLNKFNTNTSEQPDNIDEDKYATSHFGDSNSGNGWGLNGRTLVTHTIHKPTCSNEAGTVVIGVTVNKSGIVTGSKMSLKGTTNSVKCLVDAAIKTAKTFKWQPDSNAPESQIGFVAVTFTSR